MPLTHDTPALHTCLARLRQLAQDNPGGCAHCAMPALYGVLAEYAATLAATGLAGDVLADALLTAYRLAFEGVPRER